MRESCKSGSVGEAAGDRRLYPTVVESLAEIAAGGEDQSLPASRLGKRGIGSGTLGFRHAAP